MKRISIVQALVVLIVSAFVTIARADKPAAATVSDDTIRQWVKELDADKFETRQRAQDELIKTASDPESAESVIALLMEAVSQGNLEVGMRALNIFKDLLDASDPQTRADAHEVLRTLAESDNKAIAAKAASIIQSGGRAADGDVQGPRGVLPRGGIFIGGGKLQINVGGGVGQVVEFQAAGGKGQRNIHVRDNNRSIDIKDDTEGGILMTITEQVDGKDKTRTIEARDPAELKVKDPEAFQLYTKHTAGKEMGVMQNGQLVLGGGGLFLQGPDNAAADAASATKTLTALESELHAMRITVQHLRTQAAKGKISARELKPYLDQVDALSKQFKALEKQHAK